MASSQADILDDLDEECRELLKCREALEALYSSCGTTEISLQRLLRPLNPIGLDFKSVSDQVHSLKDVLDRQMQLVRLLFTDVQQCWEIFRELRGANDPDMVDEVIRLKDLLLDYCTELDDLIKGTETTVRGFHLICKIVLDYMKEFISAARQ